MKINMRLLKLQIVFCFSVWTHGSLAFPVRPLSVSPDIDPYDQIPFTQICARQGEGWLDQFIERWLPRSDKEKMRNCTYERLDGRWVLDKDCLRRTVFISEEESLEAVRQIEVLIQFAESLPVWPVCLQP